MPDWIDNENAGAYYMGYIGQTRPPWPKNYSHGCGMSDDNRSAQHNGIQRAREDGWLWTFEEEQEGQALHDRLTIMRTITNAMSSYGAQRRQEWSEATGIQLRGDNGPDWSDCFGDRPYDEQLDNFMFELARLPGP